MKLRRIRIEQFRQFRQGLTLDALQPGLNLFTGPNEAGKSTVVAALRAAFFERYRSSSAEDFRPWGDSAASPTIEVDFDHAGKRYRLHKRFLTKKRCELDVGDQHLDGAEAEDHLAELLGFQHAGKGASKSSNWGVPGLLWIQQGAAHELREPVSHAFGYLRRALDGTVGEVASSQGDQALQAVESERNALLSPATGKPRAAYQAALARRDDLAQVVQALDAEIASYRQRVDALAGLRAEHQADEREQPWLVLRREEQEAVARLRSMDDLAAALASERRRAAQAEERARLLRVQIDGFAAEAGAVSAREQALAVAMEKRTQALALRASWQNQRDAVSAGYQEARAALAAAREADLRQQRLREMQGLQARVEEGRRTLALAQAAQRQVAEHRLQMPAAPAAADVETLAAQATRLRELQIRRDAAATWLRFDLDADVQVDIAGEAVAGQGERRLLQPTRLTIPGVGQIAIEPGGGDLAALEREYAQLSDLHQASLQRFDVSSLEAAQARQREAAWRQGEVRQAEATLKGLAPRGVDALQIDCEQAQARLQALQAALARMPTTTPDGAAVPVAQAEADAAARERHLEEIDQALRAAQLAAEQAQAEAGAAQRELAAARAVLAAPERTSRERDARNALMDALAESTTAQERAAALQQQLDAARPDILRQDIERLRLSAQQYEHRFNERRDELLRLEVALQAAGAQGLEERRAQAAAELEQAARHAQELTRRAEALDYLLDALRTRRAALTQRLHAPLQRAVQHYVEILFPQAQVRLDPDLTVAALTRPQHGAGGAGALDALSFGAREQMGVMCRLAYADLLREAGRPTLIILDDALVHSDASRLAQMKRVLFDAATRHQVLLFTCHPEHWRDAGAPARPLGSPDSGAALTSGSLPPVGMEHA